MNEVLAIPKEISGKYGPEYALLREAGLLHIKNLAGKIWTDYNTHDPGITMMELLCWVITDLGYRIALPVADILASEKDNLEQMHRQFLSAIHVLPTCPVTANDYRKLLVRIEGVKNAWIQKAHHSLIADYSKQPPQLRYTLPGETPAPGKELSFELNGLYNILLDIDEAHEASLPEIMQKVKVVCHHFRNLCEDLVQVTKVPTQEIVLCTEVELEAKADPEAVWAEIIFAIEQYLSPEINFYTLREMQDKGIPSEEIFEGPVFHFQDIAFTSNGVVNNQLFSKNGFIDDQEIRNSSLRKEVRLSDIIRLVMAVPGVRLVKSIRFGFCGCDETDQAKINKALDKNAWLLCVKEGHKPVLCMTNSVINFYKDVIPIEPKKLEARLDLQALKDKRKQDQESKVLEDLPMPLGTFRNIKSYQTLQQHLPETYGIGNAGLPETATVERKAAAKQLKGYILFYDQVLANYFGQLANVGTLLSAQEGPRKTYFHNAVAGLKDAAAIFENAGNWEASIDKIVRAAGLDPYVERKNKFLDHLLARFAEQFNEYVFLLHRLYGNNAQDAIIRQKLNFYADYEQMSTCRADALDYFNPKSAEEARVNISGMEKRISRLLGFNHYKKQKLSELAYRIFKVPPAGPTSKYTWTLQKEEVDVLKGDEFSAREVEAYEEMGLSSILGCERDNYHTVLSADQTRVSFEIRDASGQPLAFSSTDFEVMEGELETGVFLQAETVIQELVAYLRNDFRLEGMYVVEHILLRPDVDRTGVALDSFLPLCINVNGEYCKPLDPYSFRIAVVLPGYSMRLRNKDFRRYAERLIRLETPAHILPRICFVGIDQMKAFEDLYELWLNARTTASDPMKQVPDALNKLFIDLLENLFTVYEQGQLSDCDDDTEERNPIVLGRTNLGSLEIPT
jgi:uncharacterized protein